MTTKKNKRKTLSDDLFGSDSFFDEYMDRIEEQMERMIEESARAEGETRGFVYGFSIIGGPEGDPVVEEFGNRPGEKVKTTGYTEIEPLVDIHEGADHIRVIAEVPGASEEDIKIKALPKKVSIKVNTEKSKYSKELDLPSEIRTGETKTSYKNGVLEITMPKALKPSKNTPEEK